MMMRVLIAISFLFPSLGIAQNSENKIMLDLATICSDQALDQPLIIVDEGFCDHFLESRMGDSKNQNNLNCIECDAKSQPVEKPKDRWKIRYYASHAFTEYFKSDMTFNSSRYKVEVKDYEWVERGSRRYFKPKVLTEGNNNPLQFIDEPTNTFVVSIEKNGTEFFLSAFHSKFIQGNNFNKQMIGTIDGVSVNHKQDVNKKNTGKTESAGVSKVNQNQNTKLQYVLELGVSHRFELLKNKNLGSIVYVPGVAAGVMLGQNYSSDVKNYEDWTLDSNADPMGVQGVGGSVVNRLEINSKKERFGLFYENKIGIYKQKHSFLDGTQEYNLKFMANQVGMKFMLYNGNRKKK